MHTYNFTKENGSWYIDASYHYSHEHSQNGIKPLEGSEAILNLLSDNSNNVKVSLDTEPFDNADVLELMELCHPFLEGGYYFMPAYAGKQIEYRVWLCDMAKVAFGSIPQRIYIRRDWA